MFPGQNYTCFSIVGGGISTDCLQTFSAAHFKQALEVVPCLKKEKRSKGFLMTRRPSNGKKINPFSSFKMYSSVDEQRKRLVIALLAYVN